MIVLAIIRIMAELVIFLYLLNNALEARRNKRFQEMWFKKKALLMKVDPVITKAELCEYYVKFREKNDCEVDF